MGAIIGLIIPIFLVIGVGAALRIGRIADDTWVEVLNRYGLYIGFPSLIFLNLLGLSVQDLTEQAQVFLVNALVLVGIMLTALAVASLARLKRTIANTLMVAAFYGNVAYLGYPVVTNVYPDKGPETTIIISIYTLILFSLGILLLEIRRHRRESVLHIGYGIIRNPFIVAILLGSLFLIFDWSVPAALRKALEMIARSASPVVLVSLGIFLARRIPIRGIAAPALIISAVRLFAAPALFYGAALMAGDVEAFRVSVLEAAMPLAITPFALSSMYPLDRNLIVTVIFITTILALLTLPFWILQLGG
jgi:hypothetical protein